MTVAPDSRFRKIRTFRLTTHPRAPTVPPLQFGLWLSLVERFVRDEEAAGSNPASPTMSSLNKRGETYASLSLARGLIAVL